jgi:hypothetical protein
VGVGEWVSDFLRSFRLRGLELEACLQLMKIILSDWVLEFYG